jgi:hypothetical protein
MKNWIIILFFNQIGGVVGPLPYEYPECRVRAAFMNKELDEKFIDAYVPTGGGTARWVTRKDMSFECIRSNDKPIMNSER